MSLRKLITGFSVSVLGAVAMLAGGPSAKALGVSSSSEGELGGLQRGDQIAQNAAPTAPSTSMTAPQAPNAEALNKRTQQLNRLKGNAVNSDKLKQKMQQFWA